MHQQRYSGKQLSHQCNQMNAGHQEVVTENSEEEVQPQGGQPFTLKQAEQQLRS